jgi:glycosyltransferase involved in cell wall biosynthesis
VVPFFSAALTTGQIDRGFAAGKKRGKNELRHILFVGRLSRAKNVDVLLEALGRLRASRISFTASIVGEGPEMPALQELSKRLGLSDCVNFTGGVGFDEVLQFLERAGILVLASETEGWPKAIVEAMALGLVAIGSDVGLVPEILGEGRGLIVPIGDAEALTSALQKVLSAPDAYAEMRSRAATWAGQYSIESMRDSLRGLLAERWGLQLQDGDDSVNSTSGCGRPVICR